jgi:predicted CXXCH cytochrome family protein
MVRPLLATAAGLLLAATAARSDGGAVSSPLDDVCTLARIDRLTTSSRECLSCHDGTVGPARAIGPTPGSHDAHPIDVSYERAAQRNPRLHSRFEISRSLALPDGQVACVTCHDGASKEPMHTALSLDRGKLCTSCHGV